MRPVAGWRRPPLRWSLRLEEEGEVPRALRRLGQPHRLRLCRLRRRLEVALPRLDGALLERADARRHRLAVGRGHDRRLEQPRDLGGLWLDRLAAGVKGPVCVGRGRVAGVWRACGGRVAWVCGVGVRGGCAWRGAWVCVAGGGVGSPCPRGCLPCRSAPSAQPKWRSRPPRARLRDMSRHVIDVSRANPPPPRARQSAPRSAGCRRPDPPQRGARSAAARRSARCASRRKTRPSSRATRPGRARRPSGRRQA